jgi:hypothetical protein
VAYQKGYMFLNSFTFQGQEYQIDQVDELEPVSGNRRIQITTKQNKKFELTFKESIFKWVISESPVAVN